MYCHDSNRTLELRETRTTKSCEASKSAQHVIEMKWNAHSFIYFEGNFSGRFPRVHTTTTVRSTTTLERFPFLSETNDLIGSRSWAGPWTKRTQSRWPFSWRRRWTLARSWTPSSARRWRRLWRRPAPRAAASPPSTLCWAPARTELCRERSVQKFRVKENVVDGPMRYRKIQSCSHPALTRWWIDPYGEMRTSLAKLIVIRRNRYSFTIRWILISVEPIFLFKQRDWWVTF